MAKWSEKFAEDEQKLKQIRKFVEEELQKIEQFITVCQAKKAWISGETYYRYELFKKLWEMVH